MAWERMYSRVVLCSSASEILPLVDLHGAGGSVLNTLRPCEESPVSLRLGERGRVSMVPVSKSTVLTDPVTCGARRTSLRSAELSLSIEFYRCEGCVTNVPFAFCRGSHVERLYWLMLTVLQVGIWLGIGVGIWSIASRLM